MSRNIFGWDLPPGCSHGDIERQSESGPCGVCFKLDDACICPECPVCETIGDPKCYQGHGLERSLDQRISAAEFYVRRAEDGLSEAKEHLRELEWERDEPKVIP